MKKKICAIDIEFALKHFRHQGGLIRELPPQIVPLRMSATERGGHHSMETLPVLSDILG